MPAWPHAGTPMTIIAAFNVSTDFAGSATSSQRIYRRRVEPMLIVWCRGDETEIAALLEVAPARSSWRGMALRSSWGNPRLTGDPDQVRPVPND